MSKITFQPLLINEVYISGNIGDKLLKELTFGCQKVDKNDSNIQLRYSAFDKSYHVIVYKRGKLVICGRKGRKKGNEIEYILNKYILDLLKEVPSEYQEQMINFINDSNSRESRFHLYNIEVLCNLAKEKSPLFEIVYEIANSWYALEINSNTYKTNIEKILTVETMEQACSIYTKVHKINDNDFKSEAFEEINDIYTSEEEFYDEEKDNKFDYEIEEKKELINNNDDITKKYKPLKENEIIFSGSFQRKYFSNLLKYFANKYRTSLNEQENNITNNSITIGRVTLNINQRQITMSGLSNSELDELAVFNSLQVNNYLQNLIAKVDDEKLRKIILDFSGNENSRSSRFHIFNIEILCTCAIRKKDYFPFLYDLAKDKYTLNHDKENYEFYMFAIFDSDSIDKANEIYEQLMEREYASINYYDPEERQSRFSIADIKKILTPNELENVNDNLDKLRIL